MNRFAVYLLLFFCSNNTRLIKTMIFGFVRFGALFILVLRVLGDFCCYYQYIPGNYERTSLNRFYSEIEYHSLFGPWHILYLYRNIISMYEHPLKMRLELSHRRKPWHMQTDTAANTMNWKKKSWLYPLLSCDKAIKNEEHFHYMSRCLVFSVTRLRLSSMKTHVIWL